MNRNSAASPRRNLPERDHNAEQFWSLPESVLLEALGTSLDGLTPAAAEARQSRAEGMLPGSAHRGSDSGLLLRQFSNPIVLILIVATLLSLLLGDVTDALIILAIIFASSLLGFFQERGANHTIAALLARVAVHVEVVRGGQTISVPLEQIVPGDIIALNAGDILPGDGRVLTATALLADESALTGEAYPVPKTPGCMPAATPLPERSSAVFMGSHVVSGSGTMVVVHTGSDTELGHVSRDLGKRADPTSFERGMTSFGFLLMRVTAVLVVAIFVVNVLLARPIVESFLFSLALAVGLTPQLLPAIVTVSLSAGARQMAREQVIVKRLDAIEDIGSMTVLCTDKTGTITEGVISLASTLDPSGAACDDVGRWAWLNARFQTGYGNPLDTAILASRSFESGATCRLDEVPYDFSRKRLSVLVRDGEQTLLITKGALEPLLEACTHVAVATGDVPLDDVRSGIQLHFEDLSAQGFRVLGVAVRAMQTATTCSLTDEQGMTFVGFLAFSDPPKVQAKDAIAELATLGVSVRMITGDNHLAAVHAGGAVGLASGTVLTGRDIDSYSDDQLAAIIGSIMIFAEIEPMQKERIVRALRATGEVVGFLGDGINDAPALHAADAGISVDTAVDVAKESAAIVLLDKRLAVIADGVRLGRRTFANTLKYINVTTSANFGNMLSMAGAAAFLPFLPLLPRQILLLNFLSDIPGTTIASDDVDPEMVGRPQSWNIASIRSFMLVFGAISSVFDVATFVTLRLGFNAGAALFRSGWFIESVLTELAVMLVLRTRRPFYRSRPGRALLVTSAIIASVTVALPFSPFAGDLGLRALPVSILLMLVVITALYILATEAAKKWVIARTSGS